MNISEEGLIGNIVAFNVGVELGQLCALAFLITIVNILRLSKHFERSSLFVNSTMMTAGIILAGYHISGYLLLEG